MNGRIHHLSLAALRMVAGAPIDEPTVVAQWLYRFGTTPRSAALERDFGPDDDPMAVLGLTIGGAVRRRLESAYDATSLSGWYSFARSPVRTPFRTECKLYVSPRIEVLADTFPQLVQVFVRDNVRSFKIGRGLEGLLRPDKIVAYFDDRAHMNAVANALVHTLRGCPAQGVPFTAEVGNDGLLSWGIDPPPGNTATSWRAWVTKRLASSLTTWRRTPVDVRVSAVLDDLRRIGVDHERWLPSADAFRDGSPC